MRRSLWLVAVLLSVMCAAEGEVEDVDEGTNSGEVNEKKIPVNETGPPLAEVIKESEAATRVQVEEPPPVVGKGGDIFDHIDDDRQRKPSALLAIPLTLIAVLLALHLWWPSTLRAGGPIAQLLVRILPSQLTKPPPFGTTGTLRWKIFTWLYDGDYAQPGEGETFTATKGTKGRKSRIKGWWAGGLGQSLKDNKDFVWIPSELSSVDVTDPNKPLPLSQVGRSMTAHLQRMNEDKCSASPPLRPQSHLEVITMTELEFNVLRDSIFENEETQRHKLDRTQNESSWVLLRQFQIELKRTEEVELIRFLLSVTNEEESGRVATSIEESEERQQIHKLREDDLLEVLLEEEQRAVRDTEDKDRNNIKKQETMMRKLISDSETEGVLEVVTRPQRKVLASDEYSNRIEIEDSEAADRLYAFQLLRVLSVSSEEAADRFGIATTQLSAFEFIARALIQHQAADSNDHFTKMSERMSVLFEYLAENSSVVRDERRLRGVLKSSYDAAKRFAELKGFLHDIEQNETEKRLEQLTTAEVWSVTIGERFERNQIGIECRCAMRESVGAFTQQAIEFHHQIEENDRTQLQNEWSTSLSVITSAMTSEMEQLDALFAERRAIYQKAVGVIESDEREGRSEIAINSSEPWKVFKMDFDSSLAESQRRQDDRLQRESTEQLEIIKEEEFIRSEFINAQQVFRSKLLDEEQIGRDNTEMMDFITSLCELESVVREQVSEEETEERQQTRFSEHQLRQIIQEDLIRGRTKRASEGDAAVLKMECVADGAIVRSGVNLRTKQVAVLTKGEILHVTERRGNRGKVHEYNGWVSIQGQTGNIILREIEVFKGELPEIAPPSEPERELSRESSSSQTKAAAESALKQVSSTWNKGWLSFSNTLSEVRLPGTPMPPRKKKISNAASTTSNSPEPRTPKTEMSEPPDTPVSTGEVTVTSVPVEAPNLETVDEGSPSEPSEPAGPLPVPSQADTPPTEEGDSTSQPQPQPQTSANDVEETDANEQKENNENEEKAASELNEEAAVPSNDGNSSGWGDADGDEQDALGGSQRSEQQHEEEKEEGEGEGEEGEGEEGEGDITDSHPPNESIKSNDDNSNTQKGDDGDSNVDGDGDNEPHTQRQQQQQQQHQEEEEEEKEEESSGWGNPDGDDDESGEKEVIASDRSQEAADDDDDDSWGSGVDEEPAAAASPPPVKGKSD